MASKLTRQSKKQECKIINYKSYVYLSDNVKINENDNNNSKYNSDNNILFRIPIIMTMMTIHSFSLLVIIVFKIDIDDFRKSNYYTHSR